MAWDINNTWLKTFITPYSNPLEGQNTGLEN